METKPHAKIGLSPENLVKRLSIVKQLSNGQLYTILTTKQQKERKEP
jgi:hypothetical protein